MNILRKVTGFLLALTLAALAVPALAAQPQKIYEITVVDTSTGTNFLTPSVSPNTATTLKATLRNISPNGNSSFNSGTLKADNIGIAIQTVVSVKKNGTVPTGSAPVFTIGGQQISVSNLAPIGRGEWLEVVFTAYVAPTCATITWNPNDPPTHYLWTGSNFAGDWFDLVRSSGAPGVSYIAPISTISLSPQLTSVVKGVATVFTATVATSCSAIPVPSVQVVATGTSGVSFSTIPLTGTDGKTNFSATFGSLGQASMTVEVSGGPTTTLTLMVFGGSQNCAASTIANANDPPPGPLGAGYFTATIPGGVPLSGTVVGFRAQNDKVNDPCLLVNYTFTNNVAVSAGSTTDGEGKTIPRNWVSLVWDRTYQPNAVWAYYATFLPNWGNATTGLPVEGEVFFCNEGATDCRVDGNRTQMKPCVDIALKGSSIPGTDPVCILEKTWLVVPIAECTAARGLTGATAYCHKPIVRVLDARDPPWGMTDE